MEKATLGQRHIQGKQLFSPCRICTPKLMGTYTNIQYLGVQISLFHNHWDTNLRFYLIL